MNIQDLLPMPPIQGPPLPQLLGIYWPWYVAPTPTPIPTPPTPTPTPSPFIFADVVGQRVIFTDAPAWSTIVFNCTITNPNSQSVTERIHVMMRTWNRLYSKGSSPMEVAVFDLTLLAGKSANFVWDGNLPNFQYGTGPTLSVNTDCFMWLEDEYGNKSAEGEA